METIKKTKTLLIIVLAIIFGLFLFEQNNSFLDKEDGSVTKIGVVLPLTGKLSNLGEDMRGTLLLLEQDEDFKNKNIEFVIEDTKGDPKTALQSINKLVNQDKVQIVISGPGSSANMAMAPFLEERKIPFFSISATPNLEKAGKYIFRVLPSIIEEVDFTTKVLLDAGYEKVAFIYDSSADSNVIGKDYFEKRFIEFGGKEVFPEGYDTRVTEDFSTVLLKAKAKGPDVYYFLGTDQASSIAIRKAREIGIKNKFFGWSPTDNEQFIKNAGISAEGFSLTTFKFSCLEGGREEKAFCDSYKKLNNRAPTFYAAHTFDLVNLLTATIKDENYSPLSDKVVKAFNSSEYNGLTGNLNFDEEGNVGNKDIVMRVVKEGVFVAPK